jgi:hypothetical protein
LRQIRPGVVVFLLHFSLLHFFRLCRFRVILQPTPLRKSQSQTIMLRGNVTMTRINAQSAMHISLLLFGGITAGTVAASFAMNVASIV